MIGWGEPGVNANTSISIKNVGIDTIHVGSRDSGTRSKIREEAEDRMDFYNGRAYDQEGTVEVIAEEFSKVFDGQEEVEVTVEQKHRTEVVDRMLTDDTRVTKERFTYETEDSSWNTNRQRTRQRVHQELTNLINALPSSISAPLYSVG
jgi:hypothetical protein